MEKEREAVIFFNNGLEVIRTPKGFPEQLAIALTYQCKLILYISIFNFFFFCFFFILYPHLAPLARVEVVILKIFLSFNPYFNNLSLIEGRKEVKIMKYNNNNNISLIDI